MRILLLCAMMGKDYDAAVLAAGHVDLVFLTPTAIANMQAITDRYIPSHKAFLILPMVGAFCGSCECNHFTSFSSCVWLIESQNILPIKSQAISLGVLLIHQL